MKRVTGERSLRAAISVCWFLAVSVAATYAGGYREDIEKGNRALEAGEFELARDAYDRAGVSQPESPYLYFNKALLAYREDDLAAAKEGFLEAAVKTREIGIEALAHYNLGNISVREAERKVDSDLEEAIASYEQAVASYQRALELDGNLEDAAVNMEVVRIILKDLLDRLAQEQEQGGSEELEEIVKRLQELIVEEASHIENTRATVDESSGEIDGEAAAAVSGAQRETADSTAKLSEDILALETAGAAGQAPAGQQSTSGQAAPPPSATEENPLSKARGYVDESVTEQSIAAEYLDEARIDEAIGYEQNAVVLLQKALEELTDDQEQQSQQDEQNQEEQPQAQQSEDDSDQDEADEQAQDILQQEEEDREMREYAAGSRYGSVDKDW